MKNIVSANWLKENIENKDIVIVDCRFDLMDKEYGRKAYQQEHIKNSVRVDIEAELSNNVSVHGGRHPLKDIEELKFIFENIGISNDSIVICYDDGDLAGSARLWWILKYLGHDKVYVLEGGIDTFKNRGGMVTKEIKNVIKGKFEVNTNTDMKVNMYYVKEKLYDNKVAIIDSREYKRYIGEFEPIDKKAGHIPGAMNYFWMNIFTKIEGKLELKLVDELEIYFEKLKEFKEVIVYCGSGITACVNSLALSEVNISHKVYSGSFSDWISYEENNIETK
ncbi:MAG: sulfurtransferase [Peptostreptococcaceae bacterium]